MINKKIKMNNNNYNEDTDSDRPDDKETKNFPPIKSKIGKKNNKDIKKRKKQKNMKH